MNREQFTKIIEKELHAVNKRIDMKILRGETYQKEAYEHKLLRRKMIQNSRKSLFANMFTLMFQ
jgi:hypothetical protein